MTLHEFNTLPVEQLKAVLFKCCGSTTWVESMLPLVPAEDMVELLEDAEEQWWKCGPSDWKEAFSHHPRIGDLAALKNKFASTANWTEGEQMGVINADEQILNALMEGNKAYEEKFGYIFIVCASGLSAMEMLGMLNLRLKNDPEHEIDVAADEQNKITKLRIQKLLE